MGLKPKPGQSPLSIRGGQVSGTHMDTDPGRSGPFRLKGRRTASRLRVECAQAALHSREPGLVLGARQARVLHPGAC